MNKYRLSFPHMGKYYIPISYLLRELTEDKADIVVPPPITKRTLELGSKYSPDSVCIPFKYNLGNYIEALEKGANVLFQTAGGCRMGFYGEVQQQILQDLGYDFEFHTVDTRRGDPRDFYKVFKKINSNLTFARTVRVFAKVARMLYAMDGIEKIVRKNIGFEIKSGSFENLENEFIKEITQAKNILHIDGIYRKYVKYFSVLPIDKPSDCIKIGIVGELYILMEPFSNYFIEKELAQFGIEVQRFITASYLVFSLEHKIGKARRDARDYLRYHIGADGTDSIAKSIYLARNNYDGIIHLKPFGCTPEVNSIPMMQKISESYKIPVLYFSFDSQTCETGVKTRLEAFYDMILNIKGKMY